MAIFELFFGETHRCGHKAIKFTNISFESKHVDFTMYKQAIPSPLDMPVLEFVDQSDPVDIFLHYNDSKITDATSDFTGKRVESYMWLRDVTAHLKHTETAFNIIATDGKYSD